MAIYPAGIFTPRTTENLPGVVYDETKTKTGFAEDYSLPAAEIKAIEETLGTNPQGDENTVSDRIAAIEEKAAAIPSGGGEGQILTKASGNNYDTEWTDPGGGGAVIPKMIQVTLFETAGRFKGAGSGSSSFSNDGMYLQTSASAGNYRRILWENHAGTFPTWVEGAEFSTIFTFASKGTDFVGFFGLGLPAISGSGITWTDRHIGFKIERTSSGNIILTATQANGTNQTSQQLVSTNKNVDFELRLRIGPDGSVDYYYRLLDSNAYTLQGPFTLANNAPADSTNGKSITFMISNKDVASNTWIAFHSASYAR